MRRGAVGLEELYDDAAIRTDMWEPALGAVSSQIEFEAPVEGLLNGMLLGIKNQIDVAGCQNWWGLQSRSDTKDRVIQDATVVSRLRRAGATLFCTTAAPFLDAPGGLTPQTLNPRSPDRVSGGSSGGSAAAVAAGLVHGALGTDSGGSIRIPAACCGVVGLQTTRGLVSLAGSGGLTYSIGNVGPLAATTADTRLILDAIAAVDPSDPYSVEVPLPSRWDGTRLQIGLPIELVDWNLDREVQDMLDSVVCMLRGEGHTVERMSLPIVRESMGLGPSILGIVESGAVIEDRLRGAANQQVGMREAIKRSNDISGATLARANHRIAELRLLVQQAFDTYDFLIMPTLPCRIPDAADLDREVDISVGAVTESRTSALTRLVNPWNLAAVPAGTLPVARDSEGAPISLQVVGPQFSDWSVLDVMESIESALGGPWDTVPPGE